MLPSFVPIVNEHINAFVNVGKHAVKPRKNLINKTNSNDNVVDILKDSNVNA